MTLIINKYDYKEIKKQSVDGRRLYACPDGNAVASVTTLLDAPKIKHILLLGVKELENKKQRNNRSIREQGFAQIFRRLC